MLTGKLLHPELLYEIAKCGHGDQILITDGNYPKYSKKYPDARLIDLAVCENIPNVTDLLEGVTNMINIESYELMAPSAEEETPAIFSEFKEMLKGIEENNLSRQDFYEAAMNRNVRLVIGSAETRTFANILLTVGVR